MARCLQSMAFQCGGPDTEVIVVGSRGDGVDARLLDVIPNLQIVELAERLPIPRMRRLGWQKSHGDLIAFTEDHCLVAPDWIDQIRQAHERPHAAIGGSVRPAEQASLIGWAVYFCEYAAYLQPRAGATRQLPGNNVSYTRAALAIGSDLLEAGAWENLLHTRLQQAGLSLIAVPGITVYFQNQFSFREFIRLRFHYGRCYAGTRAQGMPMVYQRLFALGCLFLPMLLCFRMMVCAGRRTDYLGRWAIALPWIIAFTLAWSMGEAVGYLCGPGYSCRQA